MLEEKDIQTLKEIMAEQIIASEERMTAKIAVSEERMAAQANANMQVLIESYFQPQFDLLNEKIDALEEKMVTKSRMDDMEDRVNFLEQVARIHTVQLSELKKAE